jgi:hypothetical protein
MSMVVLAFGRSPDCCCMVENKMLGRGISFLQRRGFEL